MFSKDTLQEAIAIAALISNCIIFCVVCIATIMLFVVMCVHVLLNVYFTALLYKLAIAS